MIYVIEMIVGDDFDNITSFTRIFKIGYTENFNRRVKDYHICNPFFKVFKVFTGAEFDHACEKRLHYYLADKKFDGRAEMFYKDDEVVDLINSIQSKDDIMNLYSKVRHRSFKTYFTKFRDLINRNWDLIKKVYTGSPESLVNEMLQDSKKDIVSYVKSRLGVSMVDYTEEEKKLIHEFFKEYEAMKDRRQRLKYVCEYYFNGGELEPLLDLLPDKRFKEYLTTLGPENCRAKGYNLGRINDFLNVNSFDDKVLVGELYSTFEVGMTYSNSLAKSMMSDAYKRDYRASAKASDLSKYFELRRTSVQESDGSRSNGFKILGKKFNFEEKEEGDKNEA